MDFTFNEILNETITFFAESAYNESILINETDSLLVIDKPNETTNSKKSDSDKKKSNRIALIKEKINKFVKIIKNFFINLKNKVAEYLSKVIISINKKAKEIAYKNKKLKAMWDEYESEHDNTPTYIQDYFTLLKETDMVFKPIIRKSDVPNLLKADSIDKDEYTKKTIKSIFRKTFNGYKFDDCKDQKELNGKIGEYIDSAPTVKFLLKDLYKKFVNAPLYMFDMTNGVLLNTKKKQFDSVISECIECADNIKKEFDKMYIMSDTDEDAEVVEKHIARINDIKSIMINNQAIANCAIKLNVTLLNKCQLQADSIVNTFEKYKDPKTFNKNDDDKSSSKND